MTSNANVFGGKITAPVTLLFGDAESPSAPLNTINRPDSITDQQPHFDPQKIKQLGYSVKEQDFRAIAGK